VPGVQEVLQDLAERAVPRAVGTNAGTAGTHYKLQNLGLSGYFNHHVYSFGPDARPKPAPDIYQQAAAGLGFAARDCVVIDDSATGVKAGIAAGALVIGYAGGAHRGADYGADLRGAGAHLVARNMAEVGAILRRTVRGVSL
jgi:beta-phosphoglucomutase-like phosphatase (HAD superfamily)